MICMNIYIYMYNLYSHLCTYICMCIRSKSPLQFQFFPTTCQLRKKIYMPNTPTISLRKDSVNIVPTCKLIWKLKKKPSPKSLLSHLNYRTNLRTQDGATATHYDIQTYTAVPSFHLLWFHKWVTHTFDGRNPANQFRLVVYPSIYMDSYIPGG